MITVQQSLCARAVGQKAVGCREDVLNHLERTGFDINRDDFTLIGPEPSLQPGLAQGVKNVL